MLRWLFGRTFKKIMGGIKEEEDFEEFQSSLKDIHESYDRIEELQEKMNKQQEALNKANRKKKK